MLFKIKLLMQQWKLVLITASAYRQQYLVNSMKKQCQKACNLFMYYTELQVNMVNVTHVVTLSYTLKHCPGCHRAIKGRKSAIYALILPDSIET